MAELGQMLVEAGVITKEQLDEAIQSQVVFGGRLGTNLIELGYIDEDTLAKYLGKKHNVPTVDWQTIVRVKPGLLNLLPRHLAKKYEAFPLKQEGKTLYVVMTDPGNLQAISEIGFATGKTIRPLVLPEVRVFDLLHRFYNIGRELRYINVAMMYEARKEEKERRREEWKLKDKGLTKEQEEARAKIAFDMSGDLISEDEFQRMTQQAYQRAEEAGAPAEEPAAQIPRPEPQPPAQAPEPARAGVSPPVEPISGPITEGIEEPAPHPAAPVSPRAEAKPAARPMPRPGKQPYAQTAQAIYSVLMKNQIGKYIPKLHLQEFIKLYLRSELKHHVLTTSYLANWLLIEGDVPVKLIEAAIRELQGMEQELGIMVLLPGETPPPLKAPEVEVQPAESTAPPPAEVIEELPAEALEEIVEPETPVPPPSVQGAPARKSAEEILAELEALEDEGEIITLTAEDQAGEGEEEYIAEEEEIEEKPEEIVQLTLAEAQKKLMEGVEDRNEISRVVLGFARGFFRRAALFTVRGKNLYGWDGLGGTLNTRLVEAIMLPLSEPSVFKTVIESSCHYLGPLMPTPINEHFLKTLGNEKPLNAFLIPIIVNQKVVYILYGDNGEGQAVPFDIGELLILAQKIPPAINELVKRKRRRQAA